MRALDSLEATPIPGTEDAYCTPIFSPDGRSLAFYDVGTAELKKVALQGGPPVTLVRAGGLLGATWGFDDSIIYADPNIRVLRRIASSGGTPVSLTHIDTNKGETAHRWPHFLPGGKAFLFTVEKGPNPDDAQVVAQNLNAREQRLLVQGGTYPQYVPAGYLAYVRGGRLMAVPFDASRLEVSGQPIAVSEDVQESGSGASQFGVSPQGSLVYVPPSKAQRRLVWVSRNGTEQLLPARAQNYASVRLSPDGQRVAVELENQIWLYELSRDTLTRFTFEGDFNFDPVWSPDSKRIAFQSNRQSAWDVFWQQADGSGGLERLNTTDHGSSPSWWSPDGQLLAMVHVNAFARDEVWILRLSDRKSWPFLQTQFNERAPAFSPGGHWLAYSSDESGRYEVYVQAYPGPGGKYQISTEGGTEPVWNPNGRELFHRRGSKIMATLVTTRPRFSVGETRVVFEEAASTTRRGESATYSASPDGQRLLMQKYGEATQINVVLNWFEELKPGVSSRT